MGESHSKGPGAHDAAARYATPEQPALDGLAAHLETTIDKAALAARAAGPTIMNRAEYGNAIRDLFALDIDVTALLPSDEEAYGFDNNANVLNIRRR